MCISVPSKYTYMAKILSYRNGSYSTVKNWEASTKNDGINSKIAFSSSCSLYQDSNINFLKGPFFNNTRSYIFERIVFFYYLLKSKGIYLFLPKLYQIIKVNMKIKRRVKTWDFCPPASIISPLLLRLMTFWRHTQERLAVVTDALHWVNTVWSAYNRFLCIE